MAAIKPIDQAGQKWQTRASIAGPAYTQGISSPRTPWAAAAAAADGNYRAAVTAAATNGRFAAGVRKAGDAKWQTAATQKGPTRFAEGVALAVGAWQNGFQPYHNAISSVQLPARGPAGAAQNLQRVQAVAQALRAVKTASAGK